MQARLRGVSTLVRCAKRMMSSRLAVRSFSTEATQAQDIYEHVSNMKTMDLFQFEPFSEEDLVSFPRETAGKDYSLNWSLANEWFTVWGNAYRNPSKDILKANSKGETDDNENVICKRSYILSSDVKKVTSDFEDLSDMVKDYLSEVPNLYVEDAALCSGRCAEMRIRSVTNDPVTAMVIKNMLHRMPKRDPLTPHPLSLIIARGMPDSVTAVGIDPHSKSLTVIATGATPLDRILQEVFQATCRQMEADRGTVETVTPEIEPGKGPVKTSVVGPRREAVVEGAVAVGTQGSVMMCGVTPATVMACLSEKSLHAVVTRDGITRVFAGVRADATTVPTTNELILNDEVFVPVVGDNLVSFPHTVVFCEDGEHHAVNEDDVVKRLGKYCGGEDAAAFAAEVMMKQGTKFVCGDETYVRSLF